MGLHNNHKVIPINNEELLKKENISIEYSTKQYNEINQKLIKIKDNIEEEIIEIDKLYDKIYDDITKSFQKKMEQLIKKENDLKENLQNEVTKIKEKLEFFLSKSNNMIKINDKIIKGIKSLDNNDINIIKNLSYVSKINKIKKEANLLFQELIKSIKISYEEDKNNIKFDEYFFNGIQTPKNIEFNEINEKSLKLSWNIDNIIFKNVDKNQIKFRVEIRNYNMNQTEKFKQEYEGNNNNCLIENLNKNTYYEIRICCLYNDLIGPWSKIYKIKTTNFDSIILKESKKENEYLQKIYEWCRYKDLDLIYRGTRDGTTSNIFHSKCDNQGPTICLYKNDKGNIFGGFSSISWTNNGEYHSAPESFIFTLTNIHNIPPTKFILKNIDSAVYHSIKEGPTFGTGEIGISKDYKTTISWSYFPSSYQDSTGKGRSIITGNKDNKSHDLWIKEIEVFKLNK